MTDLIERGSVHYMSVFAFLHMGMCVFICVHILLYSTCACESGTGRNISKCILKLNLKNTVNVITPILKYTDLYYVKGKYDQYQ